MKNKGSDQKIRNNPVEDDMSGYCLAKNRQGKPCKKRCHMHGAYAGAPKGNSNALKHGRYSAENLARRAMVTKLFRQFKDLQDEFDL